MTFRAIVIIGDNKRKVGVGIGRAEDVNLAIDKAILNGKKNLISVPLTLKYSVPHVVNASYGACSIMLRPASLGTGVIAGGSVRTVLELAGIKNILAKQLRSKNKINNARATLVALSNLRFITVTAKNRGLSLEKLTGRKSYQEIKETKISNKPKDKGQ